MLAVILSAMALFGWHCAEASTNYIGNSLTVANGGPGGPPPLVILGEYGPAGPLPGGSPATTLPSGMVQDVKFYGQNYNFTLYALSRVGGGPNANEQRFRVVAFGDFFWGRAQPEASNPAGFGFPGQWRGGVPGQRRGSAGVRRYRTLLRADH